LNASHSLYELKVLSLEALLAAALCAISKLIAVTWCAGSGISLGRHAQRLLVMFWSASAHALLKANTACALPKEKQYSTWSL